MPPWVVEAVGMRTPDDTQRPVTVALAEDHPLYREALVRTLAADPEIEVVGEARDGGGAIALAADLRPDVLLLDVRLPGCDGLEICERLLGWQRKPGVRVLMLSAFLDERVVARAVEAGAAGYLGKDSPRDEICRAVVTVGRGGTVFTARSQPTPMTDLDQMLGTERAGGTAA